jgi:hypothetical protein
MPISLKNSASLLPWARYSPQSNVLTIAGEDNKPREIPFVGRSFAVNIENGSMGHLLIGEGVRDWKPFPIFGAPPAPAATYKRGFAVLLYAPKLLGSPEAFEMCSSTGAHLSFCERLYNEAEPKFGEGNVPIVKITEAEPIKIGKGKSRELHFEIVKWVPRPDAFVEALAKLKAASNGSPNKAAAGGATDNVGDDFDDEAAPKEEPVTAKAEETTTAKAKKGRGKAQPEEHSSDILNDDIPFA